MIFQFGGLQFQDVLYNLDALGITDLILPFILIFTLLFAVLTKVKIFKERKFNSIIALAISLIVVIPHVLGQYPPGSDVIDIINGALPGVALWLVIAVSILLLIGIFSPGHIKLFNAGYGGWITGAAIAIVIYIFGTSAGLWGTPDWLQWIFVDSSTVALIIVIAMFVAVVAYITGDDTSEEKRRKAREEYRGVQLKNLIEAEKEEK